MLGGEQSPPHVIVNYKYLGRTQIDDWLYLSFPLPRADQGPLRRRRRRNPRNKKEQENLLRYILRIVEIFDSFIPAINELDAVIFI